MTVAFTAEYGLAKDEIAGQTGARRHQQGYLVREFRRDPLVGIAVKHPVMTERQVFQAPLLLLGIHAVPSERHHHAPKSGGNLGGPIATAGIDDEDLIETGKRLQAGTDIHGLVQSHDDDGNGDHLDRKKRVDVSGTERMNTRMRPSTRPAAIAIGSTMAGSGVSGKASVTAGSSRSAASGRSTFIIMANRS